MADVVLYQVAGAVARVTINRPERRNAMSSEVVAGLRAAVARAGQDDGVHVLVLTGAGDRAFCAGADLALMAAGEVPGGTAAAGADEFLLLHQARGELARLLVDLWSLGKPTIARVRGYALAGGFGLALACDLVVAAEDAQFGAPEVDLGLWPYVITVPLTRSMPPKKALELMMTGRRVGAAEAERIGFVNQVVAPADLDAAVDGLAATLAAKPPGALRRGRDSFYAVWDQPAEQALRLLHPLLSLSTLTPEAAAGLGAFIAGHPPHGKD